MRLCSRRLEVEVADARVQLVPDEEVVMGHARVARERLDTVGRASLQ